MGKKYTFSNANSKHAQSCIIYHRKMYNNQHDIALYKETFMKGDSGVSAF